MGGIKLENVSTVALALDMAALIYYVEAHPTYCSPMIKNGRESQK